MLVQVYVGFPERIIRTMPMLMVLVMDVRVDVQERLVSVNVDMRFGQQQPDTNCHTK